MATGSFREVSAGISGDKIAEWARRSRQLVYTCRGSNFHCIVGRCDAGRMTIGLPILASREFSYGSRLQNLVNYKASENDPNVSGVDYLCRLCCFRVKLLFKYYIVILVDALVRFSPRDLHTCRGKKIYAAFIQYNAGSPFEPFCSRSPGFTAMLRIIKLNNGQSESLRSFDMMWIVRSDAGSNVPWPCILGEGDG